MATQAVLTFHDGRLDVPKQLQADLNLHEGSELRVVSSSPAHVLLEFAQTPKPDLPKVIELLHSLRHSVADRRTAEWEAAASARKECASRELDRLYASGTATPAELLHAEREWELADDELDFGPFPQN